MCSDRAGRIGRIEAAGSSYDIGFALGRFGAEAVQTRLVGSDIWRELIGRAATDRRLPAMRALVRERFPRYLEEMRGLADGLALPFDEVFAWNCRGDIWAMAPDGCTTVQFPGGTPIIGHNEDGLPGFAGHCAVATIRPDDGLAFTAFVYPGSIPGHTFGVNAAGLVQTVNNTRSLSAESGVPRMVLTRAVLDADSLDAALALLRGSPRAGAFHLTLAQAGDPRLFSVEFTASRLSLIELEAPAVHANHLIHAEIRHSPQVVTDSSDSRQHRAEQMLRDNGLSRDEAGALAILRDRASDRLPIHRDQPDDPDHENTLATAIFRVGADSVGWSVYDRLEESARFVDLAEVAAEAAK